MTLSPAAVAGRLDGLCRIAILLCPLFLVHGRGVAEALIDIGASCLLLRSAVLRDWRWLRRGWVRASLLWWGWLVACSVPVGPFGHGGWPALLQAVLAVRFLLFACALQDRLPERPGLRRWVGVLLAVACGYIVLQMLLQAVVGVNLFGMPRFHDGTLTGPYDKPRAAAPLSRLLLPVMLAACTWLATRPTRGRLLAPLPLLCGLAAMVLAGQRMPLLLCVFGLVVAAAMLPRLRLPVLVAAVAVPLLVAASAVLTPRSFGHLVLLFSRQMQHFGQSPYGLIFNRALAMGLSNPLTGLGFDGFRHGCADPDYFRAWPPWMPTDGDGGGAEICVQHAHNHYLQALTEGGFTGLLLFCVMIAAWLLALGRGLGATIRAEPVLGAWRVGLFAAVLVQEWPIASASAFTNMPLGGWLFLLLGLGLAWTPGPLHSIGPVPISRRDRAGVS
jgi:O-antigen ligase